MKNSESNIEKWRKKNPDYNPMNNKKSREKLSRTRTGGRNPMADYIYEFILPDGTQYKTECLRQFCRGMGFKRYILTRICNNDYYKSRNPFYQGWISKKTLKEGGKKKVVSGKKEK